jgi:excisionase family DNA binding protein
MSKRATESPHEDWLGLAATARLLGVHPSTLRGWADRGELPVHRTAGGHRRFLQSEIRVWAAAQSAVQPGDLMLLVQNAIGRTHLEMAEGRLNEQSWYRKLSPEHRDRYRQSSRHMLADLVRCASLEPGQAEAEARSLGAEYARVGREAGMTLRDATEAYLFFREFLMDSLFNLYETVGAKAAHTWGDLRRHVSSFTDVLLLSIIEAYTDA